MIIELPWPNDEELEFGSKEKRKKYAKLKRWVAYGWKCHIFSIEMSSRGFVLAKSFYELGDALGIESSQRKTSRDSLSKAVSRSSYVV